VIPRTPDRPRALGEPVQQEQVLTQAQQTALSSDVRLQTDSRQDSQPIVVVKSAPLAVSRSLAITGGASHGSERAWR
jgi:hypothetical protein